MDGASRSRAWPGHLLPPALVGVALSTYGAATCGLFQRVLPPGDARVRGVILAMMLALLVGLRVPRWLVVASGVARDPSPPEVGAAGAAAPHGGGLVPLRLIGGGCLFLAGLAMLLLRPVVPWLAGLYAGGLQRFHWTPLTLQAFEVLLALAYVACPMAVLGVALNCTQRLALRRSAHPAAGPLALCGGLVVGLLVNARLTALPASTVTLLTFLFLMAAAVAESRPAGPAETAPRAAEEAPARAERGRRLLLWALGAAGLFFMVHLLTWLQLASPLRLSDPGVWLVAAFGLGVLAVTVSAEHWVPSGRQLALCALGVAACEFVATCTVDLWTGLPALRGGGRALAGLAILAPGFAMGATVAGLIQAVVQRGPRTGRGLVAAGAAVLRGGILALAVVLAGEALPLHPYAGLLTGVLGWLALGIVLAIDDSSANQRRVWPWAAVFALLLGLGLGPLQSAQHTWCRVWRRAPASWTAGLRLIRSSVEADDLLARRGRAAAGPVTPDAGHGGVGPLRLDAVLRMLTVQREPCAAIALHVEGLVPPAPRLLDSVAAAVRSRLLPDGVMIVSFQRAGPDSRDGWAQRAGALFPHSTWQPGADRPTLLAFRDAALESLDTTLAAGH